ncbi:MAG: PAS domain-containing sensor histidine kinase [Acetobacteraceae bacterium]|nr:PAS domain-containing sensor histidine kinase [Acetobacteraceae bacterium]
MTGGAGPVAPARGPLLARIGAALYAVAISRAVAIGLAGLALVLGIGSFFLITGDAPIGTTLVVALVYLNLAVLLLLATAVVVRVVRVWAERRRGSAGAKLHTRLVLLFGGVAVAPTIAVGILSGVLFSTGIQSWFGDPVRLALDESMAASRAYLEEHQNAIRVDALAMAADINRAAPLIVQNRALFERIVQTQTVLRGLTEAAVFDATTREVIAVGGLASPSAPEEVPVWARIFAAGGDVAVITGDENRVRALVKLDFGEMTFLLIGRPVDPTVIGHMVRTESTVGEYRRMESRLSRLQVSLAIIFSVVALLILAAAVLLGLLFAGAIARPVASLIFAAERVRTGDLSARVPEAGADDEIGSLTRAFNRMIGQLEANRGELMEAYRQIDERRRFTEAVLASVSAGVIGLDEQGRIELANRSAASLLEADVAAAAGRPLGELVEEMAPLVAAALAAPDRPVTMEIAIGPPGRRRTLIARIAAETEQGRGGFVVTFDDVTELMSAQRKAAWADVARRIAHEIKNPLTPIQLSAERLKRKYLREITTDPDTFRACTDTIVRQVGDIGRMVDEFSAFARMPQPRIVASDIAEVVRQAVFLQRQAHPGIDWRVEGAGERRVVPCDPRLLGQALTNLLKNAAESVEAREAGEKRQAGEAPQMGEGGGGSIATRITDDAGAVLISVEDDGEGLPDEGRERLTEPYETRKPKGTGLGLAIVKKVMEDHGGSLVLEDRQGGRGARVSLRLPMPAGGDNARGDGVRADATPAV